MRKFVSALWYGFKVLVSLGAFLMGIGIFFSAVHSGEIASPFPWGALAVFTFIAVMPWLFGKEKLTRAVGLAAIFIGIGVLYFGFSVDYVPEDCSKERRRGRLACYVFNWLFEKGGQDAVTTLWLVVGTFFLVGGYLFLRWRLYTHNKPLEPTR